MSCVSPAEYGQMGSVRPKGAGSHRNVGGVVSDLRRGKTTCTAQSCFPGLPLSLPKPCRTGNVSYAGYFSDP